DLTLNTEIPAQPLLVNVDGEAMALVISNLIGNAVKYTGSGGRIDVRIAREPGGTVSFSVEDSGIGIAPENIEKITSGFFRTEEGKAQADGFGLGLRIANDLLALHGGRMRIESEKGKGSRFSFELPEHSPAPAGPAGRP
ncbi:MAG: ATP-binding protein, partial [Elusimicrobia bacterium]|nr:ATP-binding protein [Elusimicrobiota bacterium]